MLTSGVLPAGSASVSEFASYATVPVGLLVSCQWLGSLKLSEIVKGQVTGTSEICVGKPPASGAMRVGGGVLGNQSIVGLGDSTRVGSGSEVGATSSICPAHADIIKRTKAKSQLNFGMFQFYSKAAIRFWVTVSYLHRLEKFSQGEFSIHPDFQ